MENEYVVGIDIGGTHISAAIVALDEKKILQETYTSASVHNQGSLNDIMNTWANTINATLEKGASHLVKGLAFAMPGPFDYENGVAKYPIGFKYGALYDVKIQSVLGTMLPTKTILPMRFLNDATSFAVGEAWSACKAPFKKYICITLGTGLGAAFIDHGIPVVNGETVPHEGCLWHLPYREGIADDYFSTRAFVQAYKSKTNEQIPGVKELSIYAKTDAHAKEVFTEFGAEFGDFLIPWIKKFEADIVVLGGNISKAFSLFQETLLARLAAENIHIPIKISTHMEAAAITGCTMAFEKEFWNKVKGDLPKL